MIDCSKTENFLKERKRMCDALYPCKNCILSHINNGKSVGCFQYITLYPNKVIDVVQAWSDGHPQKTMLDKFKEDYPNAPIGTAEIPLLCPHTVGYEGQEYMTKNCRHTNSSCVECWNRPYSEEEQK